MFQQGDDLDFQTPEAQPESESSNRTFLIVAGGLAGLILLSIICMAVYFLFIAPGQQGQQAAEEATVQAFNLQMQQAMTQTAEAAQWTATSQPSPEVTNTPLLAGGEATATSDPLTATMAALRTQLANAQLTPSSTLAATIAAMPGTGFADEIGLPALVIIAVVLVMVILLARRLRKAPAK
jgi:hypothetical protein